MSGFPDSDAVQVDVRKPHESQITDLHDIKYTNG